MPCDIPEANKAIFKDSKKKKKRKRQKNKKKGLDHHPTESDDGENKNITRLRYAIDYDDWYDDEPTVNLPKRPVGPLSKNDELFRTLCRYSKFAIAKYNLDNNTDYEFFNYVNAERRFRIGYEYFITFEANLPSDDDGDDTDDTTTIFKAIVFKGFGNEEPEFRECCLVG